nr:hypothetical protein [Paracoccus saliphilus]
MPLFSPLATPPNSGDPATFNSRADTLLGQLPTMVTQFNNLGPLLMSKYRADRSGTANAIVLTAGYDSLPVGTQVRFRAASANTGAATINLDGLGAVGCRTVTGAALPAGYIRTNADTVATYDGAHWVLEREAENGTNTNGTYLRLANGTQICWGYTSTSGSGDVTATFPAAFSTAAPSDDVMVTLGVNSSNSAHGITARYTGATNTAIQVAAFRTDTQARIAARVNIIAHGAWY